METAIRRRRVIASLLKKTRPYAEWKSLPKWQAVNLDRLAKEDPKAYAEAIEGVAGKLISFYSQHKVIIRDNRKPGRKYIPGLSITPVEWRHTLSHPCGLFWRLGLLRKNEKGRTVLVLEDGPWDEMKEWLRGLREG